MCINCQMISRVAWFGGHNETRLLIYLHIRKGRKCYSSLQNVLAFREGEWNSYKFTTTCPLPMWLEKFWYDWWYERVKPMCNSNCYMRHASIHNAWTCYLEFVSSLVVIDHNLCGWRTTRKDFIMRCFIHIFHDYPFSILCYGVK